MGPRSNRNSHAHGLSLWQRQEKKTLRQSRSTSGSGLAPEQYLLVSSRPKKEAQVPSYQQFFFLVILKHPYNPKRHLVPTGGNNSVPVQEKRKTSNLLGEASKTWPPSLQCRPTFLSRWLQTSHD